MLFLPVLAELNRVCQEVTANLQPLPTTTKDWGFTKMCSFRASVKDPEMPLVDESIEGDEPVKVSCWIEQGCIIKNW